MSVLVSTHTAVPGRSRLPGETFQMALELTSMRRQRRSLRRCRISVLTMTPPFSNSASNVAGPQGFITMLIVRDMPAWIVAEHRFVEVSIGMAATGITCLRKAIDGRLWLWAQSVWPRLWRSLVRTFWPTRRFTNLIETVIMLPAAHGAVHFSHGRYPGTWITRGERLYNFFPREGSNGKRAT